MECPVDQSNMEIVSFSTHYSSQVFVDQCSVCGGIWFDDSELYVIKNGEAKKTKDIDINILKNNTLINDDNLLCPKDNTKLIRYNDILLPKDIIIERCSVCNGLWLNRAEFIEFQEHRVISNENNKEKDAELEKEMKNYLNYYSEIDTYNKIGQAGKFLSAPVGYHYSEPTLDSGSANKVAYIIFTIIKIIFLILLRK